jgi:hypothetical protein
MTICVYLNSLFKRAETSALLDSGATENVTAAYATITSRLGVVFIRLSAAAFWLRVRE